MLSVKNRIQKLIGVILLLLIVISILSPRTYATAGINEQLNFQGKLLNTDGTNIANGTYNIEFKVYCGGDGTPGSTSGDCTDSTTEHLLWTEDRLRNTTTGVTVTDGVFQVNLGEVNAFGSSVDWNQDKLWLSINIGNTNASCTPFSSCVPDGEMNSMIRLTAVPYALNAKKVNGLTVTNTSDNPFATATTLKLPDGNTYTVASPTSGSTDTIDTITATSTLTNKTIGSTGLVFSGATTDITTGTNEHFAIMPNGTGKVGIGTTAPSNMLDITSTTTPQLRVSYDGTHYSTYSVSSTGAATITAVSTLSFDSGSDRSTFLDKIQASGVYYGPAGAFGGPTYSFTSDTNTGMYESSADNLVLVTNGADHLSIDSAGQVTINSGGVSIASAQAYTGAGAVTLSSASATNLSLLAGTAAQTQVVQVGAGGAGSTTPDYFALDVKSSTGDPAGGVEGEMYYNTFDNKFRCFENTTWANCIGSGGGGISTIDEGGSPVTTSATVIDFTAADFSVTGATGTGVISIDYANSHITRTDQAETITGGWTFNSAASTFTTGIVANGGVSTAAGTGLTSSTGNNGAGASGSNAISTGTGTTSTGLISLASGNASAGTAGNITLNVGTSTASNGSILIGTLARTQTITIGNSTGGVITLGASSGSDLVLNDAQWSVTGAGVASFASVSAGSGSITGGAGSFTTLTSSGATTLGTGSSLTNTFGSGASSINTIGSTSTPGALTLHGATTLDNTFTVSGSNLTSLGGNLTVTGAAVTLAGNSTILDMTGTGTLSLNTTTNRAITTGTGLFTTGGSLTIAGTGILTLPGGNATADITTGTAGNAITIQPLVLATNSLTGGALNLRAGDESAATSPTGGTLALRAGNTTSAGAITGTATGGSLTLAAGSAAGSSGTRNGGSVTINGGSGATANGSISLGASNTTGINIGTSSSGALVLAGSTASSFTVTGSTLSLSTTGVNALSLSSGGALTLTGAAASTWSTTGTSSDLIVRSGSTTTNTGLLLDTNAVSGGSGGVTVTTGNAAAGASGAHNISTGTGTTATGLIALVTGNASAGTAGNITLNVGTSTASNGSILIGTLARTQTITIGNSTGGVITLGASSGSDLVLNDAQWSVTGAGVASFASITTNTGGVSIAAGQSYTGADAVTLSSGGSAGLTLDSASGRTSLASGDFFSTNIAGVTGATSGDIWYDSTAGKYKINEGGVTKTICNVTDAGCGAGGGGARLDQITAANTTATIDSLNNAIMWDWSTLITQTALTLSGGSAMTTGTVLDLSGNTIVHGGAETAKILNIAFADNSTQGVNPSITSGLYIAATVNTSGSGIKAVNGILIVAPTMTACTTGACTYKGLSSTGASVSNGTSYAVFADAGAGGGTNYAAAFVKGNVGIGTSTPGSMLTVAQSGSAPTVDMANISNSGLVNVSDQVNALQIDYYSALANSTHNASALRVNITNTSSTAGSTTNGLRVVTTANVAGNTNGIVVDGITSGAGTDNGLKIGAGWDNDIMLATGTTAVTRILRVEDMATAATAGSDFQILGARGNTTGTGGSLTFTAGAGGSTTAVGGALSITSGTGGTTAGSSGAVTLGSGTVTSGSTSGTVTIQSGTGGTAGGILIGNNGIAKTITIGQTGGGTGVDTINIGTSTNTGATIINLGNGANNTRVIMRDFTAVPGANLATNGQFIVGTSGAVSNSSARIWLKSNGTNFTFKSANSTIADYSEYMQQSDTSEPGDVMVLSQTQTESVHKSQATYDQKVLGVVTRYGTSYNNGNCEWLDPCDRGNDPHYANVGMLGQVYTKISTENGAIQPGDPLTTSSSTGVVMKAVRAGRILGYAVDSFDGTVSGADLYGLPRYPVHSEVIHPPGGDRTVQIGKILILLQASFFDPNAPPPDISEARLDQSGSTYTIMNTVTGNPVTAQVIAQDGLIANLRTGQIDTGQLRAETIMSRGLTIKGEDNQVQVQIDNTGNASFNGTITADRITANHIDGLDVVTNRVDQLQATTVLLDNHISSLEAAFNDYVASHEGQMGQQQESPSPTGILTLDGLEVTKEATIGGNLHVAGSTLVEGILNVIDTITSKNLIVGQWADFMGNAIFRGNISFEGRPTFNNDTAGFALIKTGQSKVDVAFSSEYDQIPVITANLNIDESIPFNDQEASASAVLDQNLKYIITGRTIHGFTIKLNKDAVGDLTFSWVAIAVKDAKTVGVDGVPSPTPSPSATPTASVTPTQIPTQTPTVTPTVTISPTPTP